MSRSLIWRFLIFIAAVMLLIANISFWIDRNIVDSDTFIATATEQIDGEQARQRVAEVIVFELIGDQTLIYRLLRERAEQTVTTVLGTPALQPLLVAIATTLHQMLITGERPMIAIGPAFLPQIIAAILSVADSAMNLNIPTLQIEIELFSDKDVPSIERIIDPLETVRVPFTVASILILVLAVLVGPDRRRALRWIATALVVVLALSLVALFVARSIILGRIDSAAAAHTIASDVFGEFLSSLVRQSVLVLLVPAAVLVVISLLWSGVIAVMPNRQPIDA